MILRLWPLIPAPARGQRRWQIVVVVALVAIAPLLVVLTLMPADDSRPPVALVNEDVPITSGSSPVAVGKLLTETLISSRDDIDWHLTDAESADAGLRDGTYLAVVTIPEKFSADTATLSTATPTAATLTVQTTTQHGYLTGTVADALAAEIPDAVATSLTTDFVAGTLDAFGQLSDALGQLEQGADELSSGTAQAAQGAQALADGTDELAAGLGSMSEVLDALPEGAEALGDLAAAGADSSAELAASLAGGALDADAVSALIALQQSQIGTLADAIAAGAAPADLQVLLDEIALTRDLADAAVAGLGDDLASDAVDAAEMAAADAVVADLSGPVSDGLGALAGGLGDTRDGAEALAQGNEQLAQGLDALASGGDELASGLEKASSALPVYDSSQQQQIAQVVASPIAVDASSVSGPRSALASALAALVPIALWLGAIAIFLVMGPFARAALVAPAAAWRVAAGGARIALVVAAVQAVLVGAVVVATGVAPARALVAGVLALVTAASFVLVHQALVSFLPRAGLVVSLVLLGAQAVAAGTLAPQAIAPEASGVLAQLPLGLALQGATALVGGSLHAVLAAAIGLTLWGLVGALGTVAAVRHARARALASASLVRE